MLRTILLVLGTILAALFLIQLKKGTKYDNMLNGLDGMEFPLCGLYGVGFAWSSGAPFRFQGKFAAELKRQSALIYEEKFADYYANVVWAETITLVHMTLAFAFLLAGCFYTSFRFILAVGIFLAVFFGAYAMTNMKNMLSSRREECDAQLAEAVSTMAVLLNSGMVLREVWKTVSSSRDSALYTLMRKATVEMNNGVSEVDAIYHFGNLSGSAEVKKFTSAMLQSMEKGGGELAAFMENQSSELWNVKRQRMLQGGEKAATKLLLPIMLIFVGIMVIIMTAAFAGALF